LHINTKATGVLAMTTPDNNPTATSTSQTADAAAPALGDPVADTATAKPAARKKAAAKPITKPAAGKAEPQDPTAKQSTEAKKAAATPKKAVATVKKTLGAKAATSTAITAEKTATPVKPAAKPRPIPKAGAAKPAAKKIAETELAVAPAPVSSPSVPQPDLEESAQRTVPAADTILASPPQPVISAPESDAAKILKQAGQTLETSGFIQRLRQKAPGYWRLMRMDRPIGTLLLLWPTLWALWIAAKGVPSIKNLVIFVLGVIVMRAAGCVINDFADRNIDGRVKRTQDRPLATGRVSGREAIGLFITLSLVAFGLVLMTDPLTIKLSVGGLVLAFCYPFMKRHTHLPQVVLGAAFAWGIPMAYAAEAGELSRHMWVIYLAVVLWTVAYDTFYAMVDRDDDIKIGVKSTAILFGEQDRLITGALQLMTLYALMLVGNRFELGGFYYAGLAIAAGLFAYQQWLIRFRARAACFNAFLNNNWVGLAIFAGIAADFGLR
jgi:4-hydroxybenzoate polyprenyltransferase